MKAVLYFGTLLAMMCSLQHCVFAVDNADNHVEANGVSDPHSPPEDLDAIADNLGAKIEDAEEHHKHDDEEAAEIDENNGYGDHDPESQEYHTHMESVSRLAEEEDSKLEGKVPKDPEEDQIKAHEAAEQAMHEDQKKKAGEDEKTAFASTEEPEEKEPGPKAPPDTSLFEEGMDIPTGDEEVILPSKHPEINAEMTHVSYIAEEDPSSVHLSLEYSFFKGADAYELCANCHVDEKGVRLEAKVVGEVKSFTKEEPSFCELGPACFVELIWKTGAHSFSVRAHTDKGWTPWSPTMNFQIESEVGMITHVHEEL